MKKNKYLVILDLIFGVGAYALAFFIDWKVFVLVLLLDASRFFEMLKREKDLKEEFNIKNALLEQSLIKSVAELISNKNK